MIIKDSYNNFYHSISNNTRENKIGCFTFRSYENRKLIQLIMIDDKKFKDKNGSIYYRSSQSEMKTYET